MPTTATVFLDSILNAYLANKRLADRAVAQLPDETLHLSLDEHTNSIAVVMKHIAGNLRSRWTDFLTTDGEKPDRDRDEEFIDRFANKVELLACWEQGWACLTGTLQSLTDDDLSRTVLIRGEPHSVPLALARSLGHTCYHVGQIVLLARHFAGANWTTLTIPRGESEQYNQTHWGGTGRSHS
ncbi:MAG: DinB family protein [Planctomycetaceae bacterium]